MQSGKYYVPQRASAGLDPWATPQAYDNTKEFFETGITWSNSLNVAQTLEKVHTPFLLEIRTKTVLSPKLAWTDTT